MEKTLVILAAGIGSRFGGGIKQLESVDDAGHIIIDYSIHDAVEAGFTRIVFIIRHDIEADFKTVIGDRIESVCESLGVEVCYAFQEIPNVPIVVPTKRIKPWGTGHAVLCAADYIDSPFAVINADDYYGKEGFVKASAFLETGGYGLVGYVLGNTLSDNGGVTRGICNVSDRRLIGISETKNIVRDGGGASVDGRSVDMKSLVSMNFWCYPAEFIDVLRDGFSKFLKGMSDSMKDEYLLPIIADRMLKDGLEFSVLPSNDKWFGVTYKEDKAGVTDGFKKLIEAGVYKKDLYSDLK